MVVLPHVRTGRLRGLAVTSGKRSEIAPDLPPLGEAAGLPGYEVIVFYGLFGPRGMARPALARLNGEMHRYLMAREGRERFLGIALEPVGGTPEAFTAFVRSEVERWSRLIREAGISGE